MLTSFVSQGFNENWVKELSNLNNGAISIKRMVTDGAGNIIMVGTVTGKVDFNTSTVAADTVYINSSSTTTTDAFVAKFTASGSLIWAKRTGQAANNDGFNSVTIGKNNQIVVCGYIGGVLSKTDVNPSANVADTAFVTPNSPQVGVVVKYDQNGKYLFHHQNYSNNNTTSTIFNANMRDVALDSAGVIYVVSDYSGAYKFSPTAPAVGVGSNGNLVIATYDSTSLQWTRAVFNSQTFYGERIIVKTKNKVNSIYVTGRGAGLYNLDFDNGGGLATKNINTGFFVAKYLGSKTDMTYAWATPFSQSVTGGINQKWNTLYDIKLGNNDTIFVGGAYQYSLTVNGTLQSNSVAGSGGTSRSNAFIGALNPSTGAPYWIQNLGSTDFTNADADESIRAIHLNNNGTITVLGNYQAANGVKTDIDPSAEVFNLTGANENTFLARFKTTTGSFIDAAVFQVNNGYNAGAVMVSGQNGNYYIAGIRTGSVDFPGGTSLLPLAANRVDGYLAEIAPCPVVSAPTFSFNNAILESGSNYRLCTGKTLTGVLASKPNGYTGEWLKTINNLSVITTASSITDTLKLAATEIPGTNQAYNSDIKVKVRLRDGGCYSAYSPELQVKRADLTARPTINVGTQSLCGVITLGGDAKGYNITGYRWYKNGVLAGTSSTYSVDGNTGEIDTIRVSVTGACGVDSSATPYYYAKGPVLRFKKYRDTTTCNVDYKAAVELINLSPSLASFLSWSKLVGSNFTGQGTYNNNLSPSLPITAGATESWRTSVTYTDCPSGKFKTLTVSDTLKLTRKAIITATTQPTVTTEVCEGTALVSLSYVVSSPTTATYSWKRGSTVLPKDSATLRLKNLSVADSGNYVATATGYCNTLVSNVARVKVNAKSVITRQPVGDTVCITFGGPAVNIQTSAKIEGFRKILQWQRLQAPSTWRDIPYVSLGYKDTLNINATISTDPQGVFNGTSYILPAQYRLRVQDQCLSANFISSTFYSDTIVLMSYSNPHTNAITLTGTLLKATAAFTNSSYPTSYSYKWFKDNVLIDGENSGSYTASSSGDYKVEVTNNNYCKVISPVQKVTITSINDQGFTNQDLLLNYKDGVLQLINEEYNKGFNYELLDVQGRSIAKGASKIEIIKALNTGTYLLHIHNSNKSDVVKFVISE